MYMIMLVLDDTSCLDQVLQTWIDAGVMGATIVESTGLHRHELKHTPMRYTFGNMNSGENNNYTLFAIVENEILVQTCLQVTEQIVGNLDDPNVGVFAAWQLSTVKEVARH